MGPCSLEAALPNQEDSAHLPQGTFVVTRDILVVTTWVGGRCCWCSGGTGQAGCSMPAARRTVHTKDYLAQKVHSADREKPCPQVARGPIVRRTSQACSRSPVQEALSSPAPSPLMRPLSPPHPSPTLWLSVPRKAPAPAPCPDALPRDVRIAYPSPAAGLCSESLSWPPHHRAPCFFFLAPLPLDPFLPFSLEWDAFGQRTLLLVLFPA